MYIEITSQKDHHSREELIDVGLSILQSSGKDVIKLLEKLVIEEENIMAEISLIRIDFRLIHGQVVTKWVKQANAIVSSL